MRRFQGITLYDIPYIQVLFAPGYIESDNRFIRILPPVGVRDIFSMRVCLKNRLDGCDIKYIQYVESWNIQSFHFNYRFGVKAIADTWLIRRTGHR